MSRPRVVVLRGHNVNVWDLRPLERLRGRVRRRRCSLTGSNLHQVEGLGLPIVPARTPRDSLPARPRGGRRRRTRWASATSGCDDQLARRGRRARGGDRDVVQRRRRRELQARARLPARADGVGDDRRGATPYRWPRERGVPAGGAAAQPTSSWRRPSGRARRCCSRACPPSGSRCRPPGIDLGRFARAPPRRADGHVSCRPGGWCGRRATRTCCARSRRCAGRRAAPATCGCWSSATGRRRAAASATRDELGLADAVEFRATVPYDEMPALYARRRGARARLAADQGLGGAVRDGADRGDGERHAGRGVRVGRDPRGPRRGGDARGAGRLARDRAGAGSGLGRRVCALLGRRRGGADGGRLAGLSAPPT